MRRYVTPIILAAALVAAPAATDAQASADCPAIADRDAHPIELRIGDFVLRAQVRTDHSDEDGTRLEGRLISCERERVIGEADAPDSPDHDVPDHAAMATVLRLLHDFRVAFELGSTDQAGCIRAGVDVRDAAAQRPAAEGGRPLAVEICGLPKR